VREDARAERRRAIEVRLLDVAGGDGFDAAFLGVPAPAHAVRLQVRGLVAEGQLIAARREADLLRGGRVDVEREPRGVARRRLARHVGVAQPRVVARDAVVPAVRKTAVEAELRARERSGRALRAHVGDRLQLAGEDAVELDALFGRRRSVRALLDGELAQHVGGQPVAQVPDRGRRRAVRRVAAALLGERDRDGRELLGRGLVPQPLQSGLEAALVRDQVVDAHRSGRHDERSVFGRARAVERAVGEVVDDDEHARDGRLQVTHDTRDRGRGRRARVRPPACRCEQHGPERGGDSAPIHRQGGPEGPSREYRISRLSIASFSGTPDSVALAPRNGVSSLTGTPPWTPVGRGLQERGPRSRDSP
jgi:hypothetical protein